MVRFEVGSSGAAPLRIAYSPVWECLISIRVGHAPGRHPVHGAWAARARSALAGKPVELLPGLVRPDSPYIPDFLAPPPTGARMSFEEEITRIRATPISVVAADLDRAARRAGWSEAARLRTQFAGNEAGLLDLLVAELERWWLAALATEWPKLRA
jgi:hypothetical protein